MELNIIFTRTKYKVSVKRKVILPDPQKKHSLK